MSENNTPTQLHPSEPAFPTDNAHQSGFSTYHHAGLMAREYAAIKLRVPNSGVDWLDDMIRESLRDEFAAKAMQGFISQATYGDTEYSGETKSAYQIADAMLAARQQPQE